MIDPFTLATGVAGLIGVAIQVTQITSQFLGDVGNATSEARDLHSEMVLFTKALEEFNAFLKGPAMEWSSITDGSVLISLVSACESKLKSLNCVLSPYALKNSAGKSVMRQLQWPLKKRDTYQKTQDLHRLATAMQFSLERHGWYKFRGVDSTG